MTVFYFTEKISQRFRPNFLMTSVQKQLTEEQFWWWNQKLNAAVSAEPRFQIWDALIHTENSQRHIFLISAATNRQPWAASLLWISFNRLDRCQRNYLGCRIFLPCRGLARAWIDIFMRKKAMKYFVTLNWKSGEEAGRRLSESQNWQILKHKEWLSVTSNIQRRKTQIKTLIFVKI